MQLVLAFQIKKLFPLAQYIPSISKVVYIDFFFCFKKLLKLLFLKLYVGIQDSNVSLDFLFGFTMLCFQF